MVDRAELGLWNRGHIPGYDSDPNRKGSLVPNPDEVMVVAVVFDTYLATRSLTETAEDLNRRGYRTRSHVFHRAMHHPGTAFTISFMEYLLKKVSYIGKKGLGGKDRRLIQAAWPGIAEEEKYEKAQRLMAANSRSSHSITWACLGAGSPQQRGTGGKGVTRFQPPDWLPELVPQSELVDRSPICLYCMT